MHVYMLTNFWNELDAKISSFRFWQNVETRTFPVLQYGNQSIQIRYSFQLLTTYANAPRHSNKYKHIYVKKY